MSLMLKYCNNIGTVFYSASQCVVAKFIITINTVFNIYIKISAYIECDCVTK
jgi:hypothetical protein